MIDEYGEGLYPDLLRYWGIDLVAVVAGDGPPPSLVLSLVQALPDDSLTVALMQGGRQHFGWGHDRHLRASLYDAINQNTIASGNWKKPPRFPAWPRPEVVKKKKRRSVADMWAAFPNPGTR